MEENRKESVILAALSYFPFFGLIPLIFTKDDEFACHHAKQGLTLFILLLIITLSIWIFHFIFTNLLGQIFIIGLIFKIIAWIIKNVIGIIIGLLYLYLAFAGFINAWRGNYWEIPFIKSLSKKIIKI